MYPLITFKVQQEQNPSLAKISDATQILPESVMMILR